MLILVMWHPFGDCSRQIWKGEKVNVKCTLVQAVRLCKGCMAQRGSKGIALPFLHHGTRRGWRVSVTPQPLKEGKTIKNSSITAEITIPLTHQSTDLLQKIRLGLLSELLQHLSDFIWQISGAFLKGLNTMKSKGHWSRLTREWVRTIQCMCHCVAWTVHATCGHATLWHMTPNVLTVVLMRIQLFQVVNAVSLHGWFPALWRWQEPPKPQELLTLWHSITIQEYSYSHYVICCEHIGTRFHKSVINSSRGFHNCTVL